MRPRTPRRPGTTVRLAIAAAVTMLVAAPPTTAQGVFKSVDAQGNITYSDKPPSDVVDAHRFELPPDLDEAQRTAAAAERQRLMRDADLEGKRRPARPSAAQIRDAEQRLRAARAKLARYEVVQDDDWGGTEQGKRTLKPGYYARVSAAKEEVQEAEAELEGLRSAR
jgi:hypothetical protein